MRKIEICAPAGNLPSLKAAVDNGADAVYMGYSGDTNAQAIEFCRKHFGIKRVVLPRVLTVDEIAALKSQTSVELEIFAMGLLCINSEGQCFVSSYLTSESINTYGACSHPKFINFEEDEDEGVMKILSGSVLLNKCSSMEEMAYPTPCKGRYYN